MEELRFLRESLGFLARFITKIVVGFILPVLGVLSLKVNPLTTVVVILLIIVVLFSEINEPFCRFRERTKKFNSNRKWK